MGCSAEEDEAVKNKNYFERALECEKEENNECVVLNYYNAFLFKQVPDKLLFSKMEFFLKSVIMYTVNNEDKNTNIQLWNKYKYLSSALVASKTIYPRETTMEAGLYILLMANLSASHICNDWSLHQKRIEFLISNKVNWHDFEDIEKYNLEPVYEDLQKKSKEPDFCSEENANKNILRELIE